MIPELIHQPSFTRYIHTNIPIDWCVFSLTPIKVQFSTRVDRRDSSRLILPMANPQDTNHTGMEK